MSQPRLLHFCGTFPHILIFEGHDDDDSPVVNDKKDSDDEDESENESQSEEREKSMEDLETIPLKDGNKEHTILIGSNLDQVIRERFIFFLQAHADVFA